MAGETLRRWLALLACAALTAAFFSTSVRTPRPLGREAPPDRFSAARAFVDIEAVAARPHAVGSDANRRARDYLRTRMAALGLAPEVRRMDSTAVRGDEARPFVYGATVDNLVGTLPGKDRGKPALALMAHYDSAPGSPGAGDDAAGAAAALEVVRAVRARGVPERDLMVILTDAEEHAGLGAEAFFKRDPLAARVGLVINLEARGSSGRTFMFETGAGNGGLVKALKGTATLANAAADFVYRRAPNGTDLTAAKEAGKTGYNFAFMGGQFDYHASTATPANLEPGAVQAMGGAVLPLAVKLAFAPELPAKAPDLVFSQVFGKWILAYPPAVGWLVLAAALALILLAWKRSKPAPREVALGIVSGLLLTAAAAGLLWLSRQAVGAGFSYLGQRPLLPRGHLWEAAELMACAVPILGLSHWLGRRPGSWLGLLVLGLVAAVALQVWAPLTAYVVAWPLAAMSALAAMTRLGEDERDLALLSVGTAAVLAWTGVYFHFVAQGLDLAVALCLFAFLWALAAWPLLRPLARLRPPAWTLVLAALLATVGFIRFTDPYSPRHPRATAAFYVVDETGPRFLKAAPSLLDGPWTRRFLGPGPVATERVGPILPRALTVPAAPVAYRPLEVRLSRDPDGAVRLAIPWRPDLRVLTLRLVSTAPVSAATVDGRPARVLTRPGAPTVLIWRAHDQGLNLAFRPAAPGRITLDWAAQTQAWPDAVPRPPPRAPSEMAWGDSDLLVLTGSKSFGF
jgi:hypothetical protein